MRASGSAIQPSAAFGTAGLLVSALCCLMLVLDHLGGLDLPGCGKGSGCAEAANSIWGRIPITSTFSWPVSFLGLAYFSGALGAWFLSSRGVASLLRHLVRTGAAASLFFIFIIVTKKFHCAYCMATHVGNLAFWMAIEMAPRDPNRSLKPAGVLAGTFLAASAVMLGLELRTRGRAEVKQERQLRESIATITASDAGKQAITPPDVPCPWAGGLRGRYLLGPEKTSVRLVVFTDYQCSDCRRIEQDLQEMMRQRADVSLSIKHFPMCSDCNTNMAGYNMHPNACWAARAAEAAGILGGPEGFWKMHAWLFEHGGSFTDEELRGGLARLGFEYGPFALTMMSDEALARVQRDIEEAVSLGLHFTPMVFINGVELRGVFAQGALPRAVAAVAARNPPARSHEADQPPPAIEKCVGDWRENAVVNLPADSHPWAMGSTGAAVRIVVWGDYQERGTVEADRIIRTWMSGRPDVRYSFRHFPFDRSCNPGLSASAPAHPRACYAARAAEAAGQAFGVEAFWKVHVWLMEHPTPEEVTDRAIRQAAAEMGLKADVLMFAMNSPVVTDAIQEDIRAVMPEPASSFSYLYQKGIPTIYVNEKVVPRWRLGGDVILDRILDEAAAP